MKTSYIDVDGFWGIVLVHHFDERDEQSLAAIMQSFGMRASRINYALDVLSTFNSGLTISNDELKMSAVFIGDATSIGEWWNSIAHELKHVSDAIISYYQEDWQGEPAAYLSGYLFQCVVEQIAKPCI